MGWRECVYLYVEHIRTLLYLRDTGCVSSFLDMTTQKAGQVQAFGRLRAELKEMLKHTAGDTERARMLTLSERLGGTASGWSYESIRVRVKSNDGDLPQLKALHAFCRATGIRADYILFASQPKKLANVAANSWQTSMAQWLATELDVAGPLDGVRIAAFLVQALRAAEDHDRVRSDEILPQVDMAQELMGRGSKDPDDEAKWEEYAQTAQRRLEQHQYLGMLRPPKTRVITRRSVSIDSIAESRRVVRDTNLLAEPIPSLVLNVAPRQGPTTAPSKRKR